MNITSFRFIVDGGNGRPSFGEVTIETRPWYAPWKVVTTKRFVGRFPGSIFWRFLDDGSFCPLPVSDLSDAALLRQAAEKEAVKIETGPSSLRVVK